MSSAYPPFGGASAPSCLRCGRQLPFNGSRCENCGYDNPAPQRGNVGGNRSSITSNLSWAGGGAAPSSQQEQGRGQGGTQWGQLPVPPLQNRFSGQSSLPVKSPTSPLSDKFTAQRSLTSGLNSFGDLPPLRPPDDQFPPLSSRQDGFRGGAAPPQSQNSLGGQSAFPRSLGANGIPGSSGQSMSGIQPPGGSGRLLSTGNLYGPAVSPQSFNPAAMPANLRAGMAYELPTTPPPVRKRRGPRVGAIMGIGLLIIVLVGGAITGYMLLGNGNGTQTPNTSPAVTQDTPIFTDTFANNNNGWNLQSDPGGKFAASVGKGSMVLEDDNHSLLWEIVPGQRTFSNFKLMVDATLSKGDQNNGYGVFIRGASNQNSELATYYRFALYGDGSYAIFKGSVDANGNTTNTRLQDYVQDPAIKKNGLNHIIIIANGSAMTFIVNGQPLKTVTDNSYTSGSVALFVINLAPSKTGGQATFSTFGIYQLKP